jgi:RNA polymerase sigma factor (sigma-70 family)
MTRQQKDVYKQYHRLVFHIAISMIERFSLPPDIKDDVAQQGFLGMFRALDNGYRVTPQLIRTCINNAMRDAIKKEFRYRQRFLTSDNPIGAGGPNFDIEDPNSVTTQIENRIDTERLLSNLPPDQVQILSYLMLDELSEQDVADILGKSVPEIQKSKDAALAFLREHV